MHLAVALNCSFQFPYIAFDPIRHYLAELQSFQYDLCQYLQSADSMTLGLLLVVIQDVMFQTKVLEQLPDLTKDLRAESEMELWIEDLVQSRSVLTDQSAQLVIYFRLWVISQQYQVRFHQDTIFFVEQSVPCEFLEHAPFLGTDVRVVNEGESLGHFEQFLVEIFEQFPLEFRDLVLQDLVLDAVVFDFVQSVPL